MPLLASANTSGHWRIFHVQANGAPRCVHAATLSASVGPAITSPNETRMNAATPIVSAIALSWTFHQERPSSISYALFSVLMIALIADELLQSAAIMPN